MAYFALNQFGGGTRYGALPPELQRDVHALFGSLAVARLGLADAEGFGPNQDWFAAALREEGHEVAGFGLLPKRVD